MKQSKPDTARLNYFFITQILERYTDEEHPLSAADIAEKVNQEFGYLSGTDSIISADTVKRILEDMSDRIFIPDMQAEERTAQYGYFIYCVMRTEEGFELYHIEEGKQPPKRYYYYENNLHPAELRMLKDAVETYKFFSEDDITDLIGKLMRLHPAAFPKGKYFDVAKDERDDDSLLLMNIVDLNRIISNRNKARITYCYYDKNKKLVPRWGYPRVVNPITLMWSNGYYYLLVYNERYQSINSMRADRITDVEELEEKNSYQVETFNPVQYRHEHPVMFGGKKNTFELLCRDTGRNYIMNTIIDVFGKNVHVREADAETVEKYLHRSLEEDKKKHIEWLKVSFESAAGGVELWATQYCNDCVIISPEESAKRVKERLSAGIQYYME